MSKFKRLRMKMFKKLTEKNNVKIGNPSLIE